MKKKILNTITKTFGYKSLRENQYEIISTILKKKDILGVLPTGSGKSLCYQSIPCLVEGSILVISPLIALMNDQIEKLKKKKISCCCLNSTVIFKSDLVETICEEKIKIIYVTPEYLVKNKETIEEINKKNKIIAFAIDEVHVMSLWSDSNFRPDYAKLNYLKSWFPKIPILALTATANNILIKDIVKKLNLNDPVIIKAPIDRKNLYIEIRKASKSIENDIGDLIKKHKDNGIIIYAKRKVDTETIRKIISNMKIMTCENYHAGMEMEKRNEIQKKFSQGKIKCIVATIAFGMGIDRDVRLVINYGCSNSLLSYYQEIGRAGRSGEPSECYMFHSQRDFVLMRYGLSNIENEVFRFYKEEQINKIQKFVLTNKCRKVFLRHYFDETDNTSCNNCDNCKKESKAKWIDITYHAYTVFTTIDEIFKNGKSCGIGIVISLIRGSRSKKTRYYNNNISTYGSGKLLSEKWWKSCINTLLYDGYIRKVPITNGYGYYVALTSKSRNKLLAIKNSGKINKDFFLGNYEEKTVPLEKSDQIIVEYTDDLEIKKIRGQIKIDLKDINVKEFTKKLGKSAKISYDFYTKDNLSIENIAKKRKLQQRTIEDHIITSLECGLKIDIKKFKLDNKKLKIIKDIIDKQDSKLLRFIKTTLKNEFKMDLSYFQIRFAKTYLKTK